MTVCSWGLETEASDTESATVDAAKTSTMTTAKSTVASPSWEAATVASAAPAVVAAPWLQRRPCTGGLKIRGSGIGTGAGTEATGAGAAGSGAGAAGAGAGAGGGAAAGAGAGACFDGAIMFWPGLDRTPPVGRMLTRQVPCPLLLQSCSLASWVQQQQFITSSQPKLLASAACSGKSLSPGLRQALAGATRSGSAVLGISTLLAQRAVETTLLPHCLTDEPTPTVQQPTLTCGRSRRGHRSRHGRRQSRRCRGDREHRSRHRDPSHHHRDRHPAG